MRSNTPQERLSTRLNQLSAAVPPMPLDAKLSGSKLSWVEPADTSYITHYLIRVGSDAAAPTYVVPVGSTACNLANGDSQFWLSAGNASMGTESPMVQITGSVDLISALDDVQPISGAAFLQDSVTGDATTMIYVGRYNPPAEASGFSGVVAYWEIPAASTNFVFAGEADYDGDLNGAGAARYGEFRLRAALPAVGATWGLRLVPKGPSWRGSVTTDSPLRTVTVPAASAVSATDNAIDNASFEFSTTRWFGFTADVAATTVQAKEASHSCAITALTAQVVCQPEWAETGYDDVLAVVPGDRLQFSGWYKFAAASGNTSAIARLVIYDSAGAELASDDTDPFDDTATDWTGFSLSITAPASSAYARWVAFEGALDAGTLYLDLLLGRVTSLGLEPNKTPLDYGAAGDGTTDDSVAVAACATANDAWEVPGGYTFLTDPLVFTSRPGIRITGTGTLKKRTGSSGDVILAFDNCASARLSQLSLDANGADYCVRLGGTLGSEGWVESCDLSGFAVDPLDTDFVGGSDYYAYNNAGLADRLAWVAAVQPLTCTLAVTALADDKDRWTAAVEVTMPSGTDPEEAVGWEFQGVFFDDAALTIPTGGYVSSLGTSAEPTATFGPWERQPADSWCKPRVRAFNALGRYSAWRDAAAATNIDAIPPPPAPASVTTVLGTDATDYTFATVWAPPVADPALSHAVGIERRAFFWYNALGTGTPDEVGIGYEPTIDHAYAIDGPYPLPTDYEAWAKVGVRSLNYRGIPSAWVYTEGLMKIGKATGGILEAGLGDVTIRSSTGYADPGTVNWGEYASTGEVYVELSYEPYYTGIGASRSTMHRSVWVYVEQNIDGQPVPSSPTIVPYNFANANIAWEGNRGIFRAYWRPVAGDVWVQACAGGESTQQPWKAASSTPPLAPSTRWRQYTITQGEIDAAGAVTMVDAPNATSVSAAAVYKQVGGVDYWAVAGIVDWSATNRTLIRRPKLQLNEVGSSEPPIVLLPWLDNPTAATTEYSTEYTLPRPSKDTLYTVSVLVENAAGKVTASPTTSAQFTVKGADTELPLISDFQAVRTTPIVFGPTGAETYQIDYVGTWPDDPDFDFGQIWMEVVEDPDDDYRGLVGETKHGGADRGYAFVGRSDQWPTWGYAFTVRVRAMAYNMAGVATEVGFDTVAITPGSTTGGGMDFAYSAALGKYALSVKAGRGTVINPVTNEVDSTAGGLKNGNFEAGASGWQLIRLSAIEANPAGGYWVKVSTGEPLPSHIEQDAPCQPGQTLRVSMMAANGTNSQVRGTVRFVDASGGLLGVEYSSLLAAGAPLSSVVIVAGPAPAGTAAIRIYGIVVESSSTTGAAYLDDVTIDIVTPVAPPAAGSTSIQFSQPDGPNGRFGERTYRLLGLWGARATPAQATPTPKPELASYQFTYNDSDGNGDKPLGGGSITPVDDEIFEVGPFGRPTGNVTWAVKVWGVSQDGQVSAAPLQSVDVVITAHPAGTLDPLQLALTSMGDFQINTDNPAAPFLEITQQGVTNRIKLGSQLGLDSSGALQVTGIIAEWVLAALGAFSSRVYIANGSGSSVDLNATGTVTITNGNGTITLSPDGGVSIARGSSSVTITSTDIQFVVNGATKLTISGLAVTGMNYGDLASIPTTFPPSSHNHDASYAKFQDVDDAVDYLKTTSVDPLATAVGGHTTLLSSLETQVDGHTTSISSIDSVLSTHETSLGSLDSRLADVENWIAAHG